MGLSQTGYAQVGMEKGLKVNRRGFRRRENRGEMNREVLHLPNARSASVGQNHTAELLEGLKLAIACITSVYSAPVNDIRWVP